MLDGNAAAETKTEDEKPAEETKKSESQKRKLTEGEYDPSSPTSENSQDEMPAAKKAALGDAKATTPKPAVSFQ